MKVTAYKICFVIYVALAPFIYFIPKVWPFGTNFVTLLAMLLIAVGAVVVFPAPIYTHARFLLISCSLLIFGLILFSMQAHGGLIVLAECYSLCVFLLSLLFFSEPGRLKDYRRYMKFVAIVGAVAGVVSLFLKVGLLSVPEVLTDRFVPGGRTGTAVDGAISVLGQVCALTLVFAKETKGSKYFYLVYVLCVINVLLSGYRTYLAVSVLVLIIMLSYANFKQRFFFAYLVTAVAIIVGCLGSQFSDSGISRFSGLLDGRTLKSEESMKWRAIEFDLELEEIKLNPLTGSGWGLSSRQTVSRSGMGTLSAFGHNQYTSLAARTGLPVACFFWGLWICWLGKSYVLYRKSKGDERVLFLGAFSIISAVLLGGWTQNFMLMTLFAPALVIFISPVINSKCLLGK